MENLVRVGLMSHYYTQQYPYHCATSKLCCSSWKMLLEITNQVNRKSI